MTEPVRFTQQIGNLTIDTDMLSINPKFAVLELEKQCLAYFTDDCEFLLGTSYMYDASVKVCVGIGKGANAGIEIRPSRQRNPSVDYEVEKLFESNKEFRYWRYRALCDILKRLKADGGENKPMAEAQKVLRKFALGKASEQKIDEQQKQASRVSDNKLMDSAYFGTVTDAMTAFIRGHYSASAQDQPQRAKLIFQRNDAPKGVLMRTPTGKVTATKDLPRMVNEASSTVAVAVTRDGKLFRVNVKPGKKYPLDYCSVAPGVTASLPLAPKKSKDKSSKKSKKSK